MPRAKRGFKARRRRNRILNHAEGFWGGRSRLFAVANEVVHKSWQYAYIGRKRKKRDYRRLWIVRINASCRAAGLPYSKFVHGLKAAGLDLNRKVLADVALHDDAAFRNLAELAKSALAVKESARLALEKE